MKKTIIYTYGALMLLTLIGFEIFPSYKVFNLFFSELALGLSLLFTLKIIASKLDDVYKISLLIGGILIMIVNYLLSLFMSEHLINNGTLFIFLTLIIVQLLSLVGLKYITKFT